MFSERLVTDIGKLIAARCPLIDVRSPGEFAAGSIPGAVNIALLTDEQRHRVGTCYREHGQEAALRLGQRLVSGAAKDCLVERWCTRLTEHPQTVLYCSRGGLRSTIAADWIYQKTSSVFPRLDGGYKAARNYLLGRLDPGTIPAKPILLGGRTGSGKTLLLKTLPNAIDLETLANHRGSTFGRFTTPQPGQADFENRLAAALIRHGHEGFSHLVVEDEGKHVGKRFIPKALAVFFGSADLLVLETPFEERVQITYDEYVVASQKRYASRLGTEAGLWAWFAEMNRNMDKIGKRLGTDMLERVKALLEAGCYHQEKNGDQEAHKHWIKLLLRHYYDPMYDYQLRMKKRSPVLTGKADVLRQYLRSIGF
jgi:tRNA 2-selenouridine synthase